MKVKPLAQEINEKCWHKDHQEQNHTFLKLELLFSKIKKMIKSCSEKRSNSAN
jgi:hypothetical protein